ncbi:hypothetical protein C5S39_03065 [Candidatus Methanophagaceae archaeon]|nr:hypothetical protein C5S39_03065 [Methanophagales archaeon]
MRHSRYSRRKKKPKLSKYDLERVAYGLDKFGDLYVTMGELEGEVGDLGSFMRKVERSDPLEMLIAIDADPELSDKADSLLEGFLDLSSLMEMDLSEMAPGEKIEVGGRLKELADLFMAVAERMEDREDF